MSNNLKYEICPHLGLSGDRESHFSYAEAAHRCFATEKPGAISIEHQKEFCLTGSCTSCPRFVQPVPVAVEATSASQKSPGGIQRTAIWGGAGLVAGLLVIALFFFFNNSSSQQDQPDEQGVRIVLEATSSATPTASPTETEPATETPTPQPAAFLATATPTVTPIPGSDEYLISPSAGDIGWVGSGEERGNHFSDSYLYAGVFDGQIYQSAMLIELSSIPRGAPIYSAFVEMTGLREDRLAENLDQSRPAAGWLLRMLDTDLDQNWRRSSYQDIFNAQAIQTLNPILTEEDIAARKLNTFELTAEQINILEKRILEDQNPTVTFRLEGPIIGPDNLFAWDTGYGPETNGNPVVLRLNVGPAPATPPPYEYVVVTSTPTPENVVTAAAIALEMTAEATRIGTATPVPPNFATATPIPDYLVIVPTSTPGNLATAQALDAQATAAALTTGTPPPLPTNAVTATPIPTDTPTPTSTPANYVLITSTPTPNDIFAAATASLLSTAQAQRFGTPTPLPLDWVTPIVVTATPTPLNAATAQAISQVSTAVALTTGTPTSTPANVVTATPTPIFDQIPLILTPSPTAPPTATPQTIPSILVGKILFKSDREGANSGIIYMYDPATGELGRLTNSWPYNVAVTRDAWSADTKFRAFTKDAIRYQNDDQGIGRRNDAPAVFAYDYQYGIETQLTKFGRGIAYAGAWSPTANRIAFISNESGDDEIWAVNFDGSNLVQLTASNEEYNARQIGKDTFIPEVSKFPSWSPDGSQIVFSSNRTGNEQLWVMNADGSNPRLLMGWDNWTSYNDTEPVWVKYPDPAPPEVQ
jgi:hypothetical protein